MWHSWRNPDSATMLAGCPPERLSRGSEDEGETPASMRMRRATAFLSDSSLDTNLSMTRASHLSAMARQASSLMRT